MNWWRNVIRRCQHFQSKLKAVQSKSMLVQCKQSRSGSVITLNINVSILTTERKTFWGFVRTVSSESMLDAATFCDISCAIETNVLNRANLKITSFSEFQSHFFPRWLSPSFSAHRSWEIFSVSRESWSGCRTTRENCHVYVSYLVGFASTIKHKPTKYLPSVTRRASSN